MAEFKGLVAEFVEIADFTTICITEAHASDGFDFIGNKYKIKKHTSLQERILAASILLEDEDLNIPGTLLIDNMENEAMSVYGALPERLYIVLDGKVLFVGDEGPVGYSVEAVKTGWKNIRQNHNKVMYTYAFKGRLFWPMNKYST